MTLPDPAAARPAVDYPANAVRGDGDLLAAPVEALVNPCNCVGVMGAGLALTFRDRFPAMFASYAAACRAGDVAPGRVHVWENGPAAAPLALALSEDAPTRPEPRYIINLPTKRHYRDDSRFEDVVAGLKSMIDTVHALGIRSVALPAVGCGHGGLEWARMERVLVRAAAAMPATAVHVFAPNAALQRVAPSHAARRPETRNGGRSR